MSGSDGERPSDTMRERMDGAVTFRREVEDATGAPVAPPEPASFLRSIIDATNASADELTDAVDRNGDGDGQLRERTHDPVDGIERNADAVDGRNA